MKQEGGFYLCVGVENGIPMIQEFKFVGTKPFTAKEFANLKHVTKLVPETKQTPLRIMDRIQEVE